MKIISKIKKRSLLLSILFVMLIIGIVYAAEYYQINSGAQVTIDEWSVCKKVTNNNALAIFVPTKTADEWTAFRTYASGVTYADCDNAACSSDDDCDSGYCYVDKDGDRYSPSSGTKKCQANSMLGSVGDDCCDSDANVHPGQTAYFSTQTNCGGFDYNCDGIVRKESGSCSKTTSCEVQGSCTTCASDAYKEFRAVGTKDYYDCGDQRRYICSIYILWSSLRIE